MEFKGIVPKRKKEVTNGMLLVCVLMFFLSLWSIKYLYSALAILTGLAVVLEKEHIISEEGVEIRYRLLQWKSRDLWPWEKITTIHIDKERGAPHIMLHIGKGVVTRSFTFREKEVQDILTFARKRNEKIYIDLT